MPTATEVRYTPEDLLKITDRPMPELIDGRLVEREMGQRADGIAAAVLGLIGNHVAAHLAGLVNGGQGRYQIFPDDPEKVRIPDVSFTRTERLRDGKPAEGHAQVAPDLIVEVISPYDKAANLQAKIEDFLGAGVALIWVVDPDTRTVHVYRGDGTVARFRKGDELDAEAVLPGFRVPVATLFR